MMSRAKAHSVS